MAGLQKEFKTWNKQLSTIGPLVQASTYIGVSPLAAAVLATVAAFVSFMLFFNMGTSMIYLITGFGYPTYKTYVLLESKADSTAVRGCMTYWVVFGIFTLAEGVVDAFLSWVPLYSIARVAFQVWLFTHNFAGSIIVYNSGVAPLLAKVDGFIDLISKEFLLKPTEKSSAK